MSEEKKVKMEGETVVENSGEEQSALETSMPAKRAAAPFHVEKGTIGLALGPNEYHPSLPETYFKVKVLGVVKRKGITKYKVHFQGWNKRFDQLVDQVIADDEFGKAKQEESIEKVKQLNIERKKLLARERQEERNSWKSGPPSKRSKFGAEGAENATEEGQLEIKLQFPAVLKKQLFDDYENISLKKMLVKLPKRTPVETVFDDFLENASQAFGVCSGSGPISQETAKQILDGITVCFDRALGPFLLYSFERLQFESIREKYPETDVDHLIIREPDNKRHKRLCQVYGCEHLLRLLHRLPELVTSRDLISHEVDIINTALNHLLKFISSKENRERYLPSNNYVQASNNYLAVLQDL